MPISCAPTTATLEASVEGLRGEAVVLNVWGFMVRSMSGRSADPGGGKPGRMPRTVSFLGINVRDNSAAAVSFERRYLVPYPEATLRALVDTVLAETTDNPGPASPN